VLLPILPATTIANQQTSGSSRAGTYSVTLGRPARARIRSRITALWEKKDGSLGELPLGNVWSACSRVDKATSGALNVESEKEIDLEATQHDLALISVVSA
jgi:hypothetical protein